MMRKVCLTITCIFVFWSSFGFARDTSVPTENSMPAETPFSSASGPIADNEGQQAMTDIHDIKPLVSVPVPVSWAAVALWTAICIGIVGLLLGAWFFRRRQRRPSVETIEAVLSPEETALQRLANLSAETGMEGKAYYFQLSFIFREYMEGRFGIDGVEMTTEELLPHMEKLNLDITLKRNAKNFIVSCDPVKYAGAPTFQESMAVDFAFVKSFVEKTTVPVEDPSETAGGPKAEYSE